MPFGVVVGFVAAVAVSVAGRVPVGASGLWRWGGGAVRVVVGRRVGVARVAVSALSFSLTVAVTVAVAVSRIAAAGIAVSAGWGIVVGIWRGSGFAARGRGFVVGVARLVRAAGAVFVWVARAPVSRRSRRRRGVGTAAKAFRRVFAYGWGWNAVSVSVLVAAAFAGLFRALDGGGGTVVAAAGRRCVAIVAVVGFVAVSSGPVFLSRGRGGVSGTGAPRSRVVVGVVERRHGCSGCSATAGGSVRASERRQTRETGGKEGERCERQMYVVTARASPASHASYL